MSPPQKKVFSSSSHLKNIEPLSPHRATWNHWTTQTSAVVPQFGIANLVQISPISLGLMNGGYIYSIHGDCKPTNITRGYHLVTCKIGNTKKRKSLSFPWVNTPQACFLVDEPTIVCRFNPHLCCHFFFRYILGTTIPRSLFIPFKTLQPPNKHLNIINAILYIAINVRAFHFSFINQEHTTV